MKSVYPVRQLFKLNADQIGNKREAMLDELQNAGALIPFEEDTVTMVIGPISEKSYLRQQLGLKVGKRYAIVEID